MEQCTIGAKSKELNITDIHIPLVVSYDNEIVETTKNFISSLDDNAWEYMIIGKGEVWHGFKTKLTAYRNHLQTLPFNKTVILSDARDVLCCRPPNCFMKAVASFGPNMLVSMEIFSQGAHDIKDHNRHAWQSVPLTKYWEYHHITKMPDRKYANSGLLAGKVGQLLDFLDWAIVNNYQDDQLALCNYINTFPDTVTLDINADVLHTSTFGVNAGLQIVNRQKKDSPNFAEFVGIGAFFLHIPGTVHIGQKFSYDLAVKMKEMGITYNTLLSRYNYKIPDWHETSS
jgi:hypothetical protein